jgi:hypothetical protein
MSAPHHSKRFTPNALTEKIVPILLVILVLALLAVLIIVGLSLVGVVPTV